MFFWNKKNKDKKDALPPQEGGKESPSAGNDNKPPEGKKPKRSLTQSFGDAIRGLRSLTMKDLRGAAGETLKDLRRPKEVGILIVAIIVPGGMFGWGAYRLQRFKSRKPANENLPPPEDQKPPGPKQPRKPKGGKGGPKQG